MSKNNLISIWIYKTFFIFSPDSIKSNNNNKYKINILLSKILPFLFSVIGNLTLRLLKNVNGFAWMCIILLCTDHKKKTNSECTSC